MKRIFGFGLALLLVAGFSSCKPKQSAYKSVYEAAKEREMQDNSSAIVTRPTPAPTNNYPEASVRREKITPVYEADASGLKAYSLVVASLSVKPNAEALKERLQKEGYNVILAQNEQGLYRVIVASYDDKPSAEGKRNEIVQKYKTVGDAASLRKIYGIPFDDLWILQRLY